MRHPILLAGLVVLVGSLTAQAGVYPINKCVSDKQKEAAKYCGGVLKAWAKWDQKQDDAARDQKLQDALSRLDSKWTKAETKSSAKGSECGETTLSSMDMATLIDAAVASVVSAINTGLDLGNKSDGKCGGKLLSAAAKKCSSLLKAESKYIKKIAKAPETTGLAADQQAASAKFSSAWAKASAACPTTATEAGVEALIDDLSEAVVTNSTVSPSVSTEWANYLAPASVDYEGRTYTPTCVFDTPYYYYARRGSVNKLVMYYMGGGACWENITCSLGVCSQSADPDGAASLNAVTTGFGDLNDPDNPFKDWSWVFVTYCSCDVHFGDAEQTYSGLFPDINVKHLGYHNARVVEKWAREHFVNPEVVFVTGTSAGGYGALFHGGLHAEAWPASQLHVLGDASNGVITPSFLQNEFANWKFSDNLPPEIPGLVESITEGTGIVAAIEAIANYLPDTNWAQYTSAFDGGTGGQTGFYNIMLNDNDVTAAIPWWEGSCEFNSVMRQQTVDTAPLPGNYRYYIGTGSRHGMWGNDKVYDDTTGGVPTILNWVNGMLNSTPGAPDPDWTNVEASPFNVLLDGECSNSADNPGERCGCNDDCPGGSCQGEDVRPCPLLPPFELSGEDTIVNCPE